MGFLIARNLIMAGISAALFLGQNPNPIAFTYEMPGLYFQGSTFAAFFILVGLFYFIQKRILLSAVFYALAFYFHPGIVVWLFGVYGIYFLRIAIRFVWMRRSPDSLKAIMCDPFMLCFITFILVLPKILIVYSQKTVSLLDCNAVLGYFQYGWFSQTSIIYQFYYYPNKEVWILKCFSNVVLFFLVFNRRREYMERATACVYWLYLCALIFVMINELLIFTPFAPISINLCLMRANYFSFLFLILLIPAIIITCYKNKQYVQCALWIMFVGNYSANFLGILTVLRFQSLILSALLFVVLLTHAWRKRQFAESGEKKVLLMGMLSVLCLIFVVFSMCTIANSIFLSLKSFGSSNQCEFANAIEFLNAENKENLTVLYPFDKSQEYFAISEKPGFFNDYYIVLFSSIYAFDPKLQQKAYNKFKKLENEFGINTLNNLMQDPLRYSDPWSKAWSDLIDESFVIRWRETDPIGYVVREENCSRLGFPIVYKNPKYIVYKVN